MLIGILVAPVILFLCAYLIKVKKMAFLISGYNTSSKAEKEKYNKDALFNAIGNMLFLIGSIYLLPLIPYFFISKDLVGEFILYSSILITIVSVFCLIKINKSDKIKKKYYF